METQPVTCFQFQQSNETSDQALQAKLKQLARQALDRSAFILILSVPHRVAVSVTLTFFCVPAGPKVSKSRSPDQRQSTVRTEAGLLGLEPAPAAARTARCDSSSPLEPTSPWVSGHSRCEQCSPVSHKASATPPRRLRCSGQSAYQPLNVMETVLPSGVVMGHMDTKAYLKYLCLVSKNYIYYFY